MKKKTLLMLIIMLFCISLVSKANKEDSNTIKADTQLTAASLTVGDVARYLETRNEHYPLSDEFIEKYQQKSGGYIANAKKAGLVVDKQLHEPNQKWHFFDSWIAESLKDGTLTADLSANAKTRIYTNLQCPELMLWIYEACQVSPAKVSAAKVKAEEGKVAGKMTSTIAKDMRTIITWEETAAAVIEYLQGNPESASYSISVVNGAGFEVTGLNNEYTSGSEVSFTVNVTDSTKMIDKVKFNNTVLNPVNGNNYKFTMPRSNVTITVTLKDIPSGDVDDNVGGGSTTITSNAKYNIKYDLGSKTQSVKITDTTTLFNVFELTNGEESIISSVEIFDDKPVYGGGYGGSGSTKWYSGDMLKFGTASVNGGIVFNLKAEISSVIITGYIHKDGSKIRIGDASSSDWTIPDSDNLTTLHTIDGTMTVASKETVEANQTSTITIDFASTDQLRLETVNTRALYITSIEFVLTNNAK